MFSDEADTGVKRELTCSSVPSVICNPLLTSVPILSSGWAVNDKLSVSYQINKP